MALLIECLSDNRNRTIAEVRRVFNRANSALAEPNAVAWQFTRRGLILVEAEAGEPELDGEDVFMEALEAGAEDFEEDDGTFEIYTEGTALAQTADNLRQAGLPVRSVELIMHPNQTMDPGPGRRHGRSADGGGPRGPGRRQAGIPQPGTQSGSARGDGGIG